MSKDRQKISILVVLLAVLGLTLVLAYRMNQPQITAAVQLPQAKPSANPPAPADGQIRLDLLQGSGSAQEEIGKRNLFQYQQAPPPPPPPGQRGPFPNSGQPPFGASAPTTVTQPLQSRPPAPPPIPLKYQGFALTSVPNRLIAFVADDTRHYNVTAGEILMGRYRIVSITEKAVEVEDLDSNRRQTLPIVK